MCISMGVLVLGSGQGAVRCAVQGSAAWGMLCQLCASHLRLSACTSIGWLLQEAHSVLLLLVGYEYAYRAHINRGIFACIPSH